MYLLTKFVNIVQAGEAGKRSKEMKFDTSTLGLSNPTIKIQLLISNQNFDLLTRKDV